MAETNAISGLQNKYTEILSKIEEYNKELTIL